MKGQPAESKNQHQTENGLCYFSPLNQQQTNTETVNYNKFRLQERDRNVTFAHLFHVIIECDAHAFIATKHFTGHERVEDSCAGQWEAEIETKEPIVFHILVELGKEKTVNKCLHACNKDCALSRK